MQASKTVWDNIVRKKIYQNQLEQKQELLLVKMMFGMEVINRHLFS